MYFHSPRGLLCSTGPWIVEGYPSVDLAHDVSISCGKNWINMIFVFNMQEFPRYASHKGKIKHLLLHLHQAKINSWK